MTYSRATIIVCDGDQTGQELLLEAPRAITPELLGVPIELVHYDMSLDEDLHPQVAMAEAPHGTAPSLEGKNVANPMAMLLDQAAIHLGDARYHAAGKRLRSATLEGAPRGTDLRPRERGLDERRARRRHRATAR